jgi:hypothetical protein
MTIKWVKSDPLVMNGEPFCYGSRLTVRQVLDLRRNGYTVTDLLKDRTPTPQSTAISTPTSSTPTAPCPGLAARTPKPPPCLRACVSPASW